MCFNCVHVCFGILFSSWIRRKGDIRNNNSNVSNIFHECCKRHATTFIRNSTHWNILFLHYDHGCKLGCKYIYWVSLYYSIIIWLHKKWEFPFLFQVCTILVLNYHHRLASSDPMPQWVQTLFLQWIPWALRLSRPGNKITRKSIHLQNKVRYRYK